MKHTLTLLFAVLLACASNVLYGQAAFAPPHYSIVNQPGATLEQVVDTMIAGANPYDTGEGGAMDRIAQFSAFWQGRVIANDYSGMNMFTKYFVALESAAAGSIVSGDCGPGVYQGDWVCLGPNNMTTQISGKVNAVWVDPTDSTYLLAGTEGGLFKSTTAGATWTCITDNAPIAGPSMFIGSIAVDPLNKDTIILGTNGAGIIKSFDGGATWTQEDLLVTGGENVNHVAFTPDGIRLYALIAGSNSVATRLAADGSYWDDITPAGVDAAWVDLQFVPSNRSHMFLSTTQNGPGSQQGIWETTDSMGGFGLGWTDIMSSFSSTIAGVPVTPANLIEIETSLPGNDTLYFVAMDNHNQVALYKYNLSGTPGFSQIYDNVYIPTAGYAGLGKLQLLVSPSNANNIFYGSDVPSQAYDRTHGFVQIGYYHPTATQPTHADIRCIYLQHDGSAANGMNCRVYIATDGGVSEKPINVDPAVLSTNTTKDISGSGLNCGTFWQAAIYESDDLIGSMMHDGAVTYQPGFAQPWWSLGSADAFSCEVDKAEPTSACFSYGASGIVFNITSPASGRDMGTYGSFPTPSDPPFDSIGAAPPWTSNSNGDIYTVKNNVWRKRPSDGVFIKGNEFGWGFPSGDTLSGAGIAINTDDTTFNGYVCYNTCRSCPQHIYYRFPGDVAHEISGTVSNVSIFPITGIVTDPRNTQRVWITQGAIDGTSRPVTRYRVQYSPDHGTTWIDVSNGLPQPVPAQNIVYDESCGRLYCMTDIGVYTCNFDSLYQSIGNFTNSDGFLENDNVNWTCFNQGAVTGKNFPMIGTGSLTINHCEGKLYASTYGRSVWSSDLNPPGYVIQPAITIPSGTTTWSGQTLYMRGSIDVQPGATFTISGCTIHMPKDATITVEPGGHLIVDGSDLTNQCASCFWQGIQAWGNASLSQTPTSNQGWVIIKNNSVIENATDGVCNYNESLGTIPGAYWGTQGGVIQASGSTFKNNKTCVTFAPYDNYVGTTLYPNLSDFYNSTFLLDSTFKGDPLGYHVTSMINLSHVEGIIFEGCQFHNRDTAALNKLKGDGIFSSGSGFAVGLACPGTVICLTPSVPCVFTGFTNAIDIQEPFITNLAVNIDQAQFDSSSVGVFASAFNNVNVKNSTFKIGHGLPVTDVSNAGDPYDCSQNIGVLLQNCAQFQVQSNTFTGYPSTSVYNFGTVVAHSGYSANRVNNNTFDSLNFGAFALGVNAMLSLPFTPPADGLKMLCDSFAQNTCDIFVTYDSSAVPNQGIAVNQGTYDVSAGTYLPAGNTFSGSTTNIYNAGMWINYYYDTLHSSTERPSIVAGPVPVNRDEVNQRKSCAIGSVLPNGHFYGLSLTGHKAAFNLDKARYTDSLTRYNSEIDHGSTSTLISDIIASSDTSTLYSLLAGYSPYISELALKAVADNGKLPYYSMVNIMELNPDDLHDNNFVAYVSAIYNFLTGDLAAINAAAHINTSRTSLEGAINGYQSSMNDEANNIMTMLKTPVDTSITSSSDSSAGICMDSTNVFYTQDSNSYYIWFDSIDTWLNNIGSLWADYERVSYNNFLGNYSTANTIFNSISSDLPTAADSNVYKTYTALWQVIYGADTSGESIFTLDGSYTSLLDTSAVTSFTYNTASLVTYSTVHFVTPTLTPGMEIPCAPYYTIALGGKQHSDHPTPPPIIDINTINSSYQFEAYPNPTNGIVTFSYNVPGSNSMRIEITNVVGELVATLQTGNGNGNLYWDSGKMPAGIYMYQASNEKGNVCKGKLVVVK